MSTLAAVEIVSTAGLMGGEPCFAGTRIPARMIRSLMEGGMDGYSGDDIHDLYPPLAGLDLDSWFRNE